MQDLSATYIPHAGSHSHIHTTCRISQLHAYHMNDLMGYHMQDLTATYIPHLGSHSYIHTTCMISQPHTYHMQNPTATRRISQPHNTACRISQPHNTTCRISQPHTCHMLDLTATYTPHAGHHSYRHTTCRISQPHTKHKYAILCKFCSSRTWFQHYILT